MTFRDAQRRMQVRLLAGVRADDRVLGLLAHPMERAPFIATLVLKDEAMASFYQERHDVLARWVPVRTSWDVNLWGPAIAFFTEDRALGLVEWIGWGQVPEYPLTDVEVAWDKTGRLAQRLQGLGSTARVEFNALSRATFTFWSQFWLARQWHDVPARCTFHASQAFLALAEFWRVAFRIVPQRWVWGGSKGERYAPLEKALPYVRDCARWLAGLRAAMLEASERVSAQTGWTPPFHVEEDA